MAQFSKSLGRPLTVTHQSRLLNGSVNKMLHNLFNSSCIFSSVLVSLALLTSACTSQPSTKQPSSSETDSVESVSIETQGREAAVSNPSVTGPSVAEPSTAQPSTAQPSTAEMSTAAPSTAEMSTAEMSTAAPSTAEMSTVQFPEVTSSEVVIHQNDEMTVFTLSADVLFDFDKSNIRPDAESALQQLSDAIAERFPNEPLQIHGHTDSKGTDEYNIDLSDRRAASVQQWLSVHANISPSRMTLQGHGEHQPVADNAHADGSDNPMGRQLNRRVEIVVLNR